MSLCSPPKEFGSFYHSFRNNNKAVSGTCGNFMGLKDDFGKSLGHLYVDSSESHISAVVPWTILRKPTMDKVNSRKVDSDKDTSEETYSSSGESEESTNSDNESELSQRLGAEPCRIPKAHRQLCRSPCIEPYILKRNEILQDLKTEEELTGTKEVKKPPDVVKEYQTKLDFALKLGYSEEQVLLVLNKLGPNALINDILGELVKLGSKSESDQNGVSSTPVMREALSTDSQRSESPFHQEVIDDSENLRPIVIDGSNVAMSHGNKEVFSCRGIKLAVTWFLERGHKDVTVFVPAWRKEQSRPDALITDQEILRKLEKEKILVFTPSRRVQGRRVVCYDDRFIVKLAFESDGIIVSNDNYRDLANEKPEWKKFIDERLLMYSFVNDKFMPPDDPLGRHGPSLDNFLRKKPVVPEYKKQPCPYGKKCTYGHKCKYYHPERGNQPQRSVADELRAMSRSTIAKTSNEIGLVKSNSVPSNTRMDSSCDLKRSTPKRQSDPSIRTQAYELEEKLATKNKFESRSVPSLVSTTPSSNGLLSVVHLPTQDTTPPGLYSPMLMSTKNHGTISCDQYPKCESPVDVGYYSMMNAYSNLSLSGHRSPERRFSLDTDYRISSVASDCSSEGSVSCGSSDSYAGYNDRSYVSSPDPHLDENLKCQHMHPHSRSSAQAFLQGYHESLTRVQSYGHEPEPKHHHKPHPPYMSGPPQHHAVAARSSCPNDYNISQNSPVSKNVIMGRSLVSTRMESVSDSRLYESPPMRHHKPYISQESPGSWDRPNYGVDPYGYRQTFPMPGNHSQPCYEQFAFQSPPEHQDQSWRVPYCGMSQEPSRYQGTREKVFINLCNIFPAELVRIVMKRNPHVTDAQQLAAAILVEKSQYGY
ncbi:probable ribonuclease ZC3H12C [Spea bombifrons]|uniref:probable ribonuclease ZC3H12C n=1 Tax=Spea bombifrons TaxID=233779 RepID=UPI00234AEE35|nr:probable ribonuclease ZC3H12C [Spea bombifrons]